MIPWSNPKERYPIIAYGIKYNNVRLIRYVIH